MYAYMYILMRLFLNEKRIQEKGSYVYNMHNIGETL
jgi:hypothetical protein